MGKYHFIGIGGIGMSGLARLLLAKKCVVSGSDIADSAVVEALRRDGADVRIGHAAHHVPADSKVIFSTDIKQDNPEYQAALKYNCPMLHRSELLGALMQDYHALAVAGTHGKTTTSSLLAWVLQVAQLSPSYAIGGVVPQLSSNAHAGGGTHFVAEACESDGSFKNYHPQGAIITNIDFDHMDYYGSEEALIRAFGVFAAQVSLDSELFWCGDDTRLCALHLKGSSYGFGKTCTWRASAFKQKGWNIRFDAACNGKIYRDIDVSLIGRHNALNALAVFALALQLGIDETIVRKALSTFRGVNRRCEKVGETHGILILDDYGHHPTELKAVLKAIRSTIGARRLVVVYQPHRFSRTLDCLGRYGGIFDEADLLFVNEIYGAREAPIAGLSHHQVVDEIKMSLGDRCQACPRADIASVLADVVRPHDVVLTLGAGDVTGVGRELLSLFAKQAPQKLKLGLIFGGRSVEHEVSMISSANITSQLNSDYYDTEFFGIGYDGVWEWGADARKKIEEQKEVQNTPVMTPEVLHQLLNMDVVFPVLHGPYGEDGTIQGLLDMFSKAYVGCDHRSAAISMDKALSKRLVMEKGLPALPFITFSRHEWNTRQEEIKAQISAKLTYPLFVKPVHLGSTIGVHKVKEYGWLDEAIADAFRYDTHLIVENGLETPREIEFSLLGNDDPIVFPPGEVLADGNVHDFDSKYGLNPVKPAADYKTIAVLPEDKVKEGMELALAAYQAVGGVGMARVDTFLDASGKFWFNEINPIPGFTKYSLFPLMCQAHGLPLTELIDTLIVLGLQRRRELDRLQFKRDVGQSKQ